MFGLSFFEVLVVGLLALFLIGPKELPQVARFLGRIVNEIRRAGANLTDEIQKSAGINASDIEPATKKNEIPQLEKNPKDG